MIFFYFGGERTFVALTSVTFLEKPPHERIDEKYQGQHLITESGNHKLLSLHNVSLNSWELYNGAEIENDVVL